jgi:hypothetical protein
LDRDRAVSVRRHWSARRFATLSKASIERYNLLIDHNRQWFASLARSSDIGADAVMRRRLFDHLDLSLKCLERHRDCLVADLARQLQPSSAEGSATSNAQG